MPNFVKGLADVNKSHGVVLFHFQGTADHLYSVYLLSGAMFYSKAKFVARYQFFSIRIGFSHFSNNFSKTLETTGSRLIGLCDLTSCWLLPGFGSMIICDAF